MLQKVLISAAVLSTITYAELRDQPIYPLSLHSIEYFEQDEEGVLTARNTITAISETDISGNKTITTRESSIAGTYIIESLYDHNDNWIKDIEKYQGRGISDSSTWSYDEETKTKLYIRKGNRVPDSRSYEKSSESYNESGLLVKSTNFQSYSSSMNPTEHSSSDAEYFYSNNRLDSVKVGYRNKHLLKKYTYNQHPEHEEVTITRTFSRGDSIWDGEISKILRAPTHSTVIHYIGNTITGSVKTSYNENKRVSEVCTMDETGDTITLTETSYTEEGYIDEIKSLSNVMGELQVKKLQRYRYNEGATSTETVNNLRHSLTPGLSVSTGRLNITLHTGVSTGTLRITDIKGRLIKEKSFNSDQISFDISSLASGVYFATIKTMGNDHSLRFMR